MMPISSSRLDLDRRLTSSYELRREALNMPGLFRLREALFVSQTLVEPFVADESEHLSSHRDVAATGDLQKPAKTNRAGLNSRLFGRREKRKIHPEKDCTSTTVTVKTAEPDQTARKTGCWSRVFTCCRKRNRVAPARDTCGGTQRRRPKTPTKTNEQPKSRSFPREDEVVPFDEGPEQSSSSALEQSSSSALEQPSSSALEQPSSSALEQPSSSALVGKDQSMSVSNFLKEQLILQALIHAENNSTARSHTGFSNGSINRFGFPNIGQSCYLNSALQGLLTLEDFVRDVSLQERLWSSVPEAQLLRRFMAIRDAHNSTVGQNKSRLLGLFKEAVSVQAPEFGDQEQKDAHEFLTSVLDQMRSLSPLLTGVAANTGRRYTCPVEKNLVFKMENTRTCKRCGARSRRQEDFTNLSLDLVARGSVEQMLQEYQTEVELEFRCECGGRTSGQRSEFATLPNVLVLHLKRFRFTPTYRLAKVHEPVELLRDIVVSSKEGGACYSLISTISHFGSTQAGHYVCDSIHPEDCPEKPTDRWLTFNDSRVTETTGWSVCQQRRQSAYVLFYKRHE